ncbi:MAG: PHP domain-containing protein [Firmicutes bacterium]|nr:PHP domain-containing protein [Bacillota bacterium]
MIDLHTHSTVSDGSYTPTELVEYAYEKGLKALALTDHDDIAGVEEAKRCAENFHIELVPGIEFSTEHKGQPFHMVGLFIDTKNKELLSALEYIKSDRARRNEKIISALNKMDMDIELKEVEAISGGGVISRAHFAAVLKQKGYVKSYNEAFDRFLGDGKSAYVKREAVTAPEAISLIHRSGGIAVIAHPLIYRLSERRLLQLIEALKELGVDAIEAYYSSHRPSDTRKIKEYAQRYGLLLSGGSDFHGSVKPGLDLGTGYGKLCVPDEVLEKLRGRLNGG